MVSQIPNAPLENLQNMVEIENRNIVTYKTVPAALASDQYVPLLQGLIFEFVYKVISAPEGQFEQVHDAEWQILLDNHLQDVLDERGAWYDANH
jgi:putative aldouronate transport system substrate-binding protein